MTRIFETVAKDRMILLPEDAPASAHCVVTILDDGLDSLRDQSQIEIPSEKQQRMSELLQKNREETLTQEEQRELDALAPAESRRHCKSRSTIPRNRRRLAGQNQQTCGGVRVLPYATCARTIEVRYDCCRLAGVRNVLSRC